MTRKTKSGGIIYSTNSDYHFEEPVDAPETLPAAAQRLQVRLETKHRKGKVVTLVEGFVGKKEDLEALGKKLKTACGSGGSAKDQLIIVQGAHLDQVKSLLRDWGYPLR